ncbi:MAG: rhodanese-like domain-containing protein [Pseudomonadota bacterium]|nr:rhodanese-like domain-containing protein [Pseudomonadota bacterium]
MKTHDLSFLELVKDALTRVREVGVVEVKNKIDKKENFLLIDVREESEWLEGKIPEAIYFGKGIIERDIEANEPDKEKEMILYCQGGFRSALAADSLQKMGYRNVFSMSGGFGEWSKNNFPVT